MHNKSKSYNHYTYCTRVSIAYKSQKSTLYVYTHNMRVQIHRTWGISLINVLIIPDIFDVLAGKCNVNVYPLVPFTGACIVEWPLASLRLCIYEIEPILPKVYHSKGDRLWRKRYHSHIHKQMLLRDKYRTPQPECPGLLLSFNDISHLSYQYRVWGVV